MATGALALAAGWALIYRQRFASHPAVQAVITYLSPGNVGGVGHRRSLPLCACRHDLSRGPYDLRREAVGGGPRHMGPGQPQAYGAVDRVAVVKALSGSAIAGRLVAVEGIERSTSAALRRRMQALTPMRCPMSPDESPGKMQPRRDLFDEETLRKIRLTPEGQRREGGVVTGPVEGGDALNRSPTLAFFWPGVSDIDSAKLAASQGVAAALFCGVATAILAGLAAAGAGPVMDLGIDAWALVDAAICFAIA